MSRRPDKARPVVTFSKAETTAIVRRLQVYFDTELDQKLGDIPAQMLLDFLIETIGPAFYNRGLYDAQSLVMSRVEEIGEAILGLEK